MLKNILKVNGAQQLSKNEQQVINGGAGLNCVPGSCINCYTRERHMCCTGATPPSQCD